MYIASISRCHHLVPRSISSLAAGVVHRPPSLTLSITNGLRRQCAAATTTSSMLLLIRKSAFAAAVCAMLLVLSSSTLCQPAAAADPSMHKVRGRLPDGRGSFMLGHWLHTAGGEPGLQGPGVPGVYGPLPQHVHAQNVQCMITISSIGRRWSVHGCITSQGIKLTS